ncbi:GntR family transcriptional regulator [Nocardia sp. X0981]
MDSATVGGGLDLSIVGVDARLTGRRITADYIAESLRNAINAGDLGDGAPLNQVELAAHFGVSRVPVREALRQLQAEGLIDSRAHRFSSVRGTDPEQLMEVFSLRGVIEGWIIERAVPVVDAGSLARAAGINQRLREESDHPAWLALNTEFHDAIMAPAGTRTGLDVLRPLRQRSERYARLWSRSNGVHRPIASTEEHEEILQFMAAGDAAGARAAAEQHVLHSCAAVLEAGRRMRGDDADRSGLSPS